MRNKTFDWQVWHRWLLACRCWGDAAKRQVSHPAPSMPQAVTAPQAEDMVALVGDQVITFSELNTMLNSSAVVGLSVPALGTPKRSQVIIPCWIR